MKKLLFTLFILTPILIITACSPKTNYEIVVTDYFTYDIVKQVVGDTKQIKMLQPAHMDYHSYEPSSSDLVILKKTELFIYTSINQAPWLGSEDNIAALLSDGAHISFEALLDIEPHHHDLEDDHEDEDEHENDHDDHDHGFDFISNPFYVVTIVDNLAHYLADKFPNDAEIFIQNGHDYKDMILNLVTPYHEQRSEAAPMIIYFVGHNALAGLQEAFNLDIHALDENVSPNSDTTSTEVSAFIKALQDNNITTLFVEELADPATIEFIRSRVNNLEIVELHTFHKITTTDYNNHVGYLDIVSRNILNLQGGN